MDPHQPLALWGADPRHKDMFVEVDYQRRSNTEAGKKMRPEVARKFADLGADPQFGTPAEFAAYVADDLAKWARLAKEAGLKVE